MRVLQFIPSLNAYDGGTATYMQQLAPCLGREVELHICVLTPVEDCMPMPGARLHSIELRLSRLLRMRQQWMQLLEEVQPDVLHVNCCWMPHCALVQRWTKQWSKKVGQPVRFFLTPHGMLEPWLIRRNYWSRKIWAIWGYQRAAVREADGVIATAVEEQQHLRELGWCDPDKVHLLPNGMDVQSIEPKREQSKEVRQLLFMSRLHPKKGLEMLIDALSQFPQFQLTIAGEGDKEYVDGLKRRVEERGLQERCHFLGAVYGDAKWEVIGAADVVVLPSHSENFGLIVAEALSCEVPVLTTQGTPWSELESRRCGWWVEVSVQGIAEGLQRVASTSPEEIGQMGRRGRLLMLEKYDIRRLASALLSLYQEKLTKK